MNIRLGAHLSISGGYTNPLNSIYKKGGNALQIFSSSPRGWSFPNPPAEAIEEFVKLKKELDIDPVYFHASYLANFADKERTGEMSRKSLVNELNLAAKMGIRGSIIHLGSYKNTDKENTLFPTGDDEKYQTLLQNISYVLSQTPENTLFIIENAGNRKIGQTIDEIANIIKDVHNNRVRVCLDTCHLHAAGYNLNSEKNLEAFLTDFDKKIGIDKLEVWHVNDSRDTFGALRDRHENIGEGYVGIETFNALLHNHQANSKAFIIETPGFDDKGPDKKNLDILKSLL